MKLLITFILIQISLLQGGVKEDVNEFLRKLDGNFKERKEASKQLHNMPVEFYPFLRDHLKTENVSTEVKLRLTKEKMFPLRAKWLHQQRLDWYRKHVIEAYKKHGHRDPKWDEHVFKGFDLVLEQFDKELYIRDYSEKIYRELLAALADGCRDALVLFFYARASVERLDNADYEELRKRHLKAKDKLLESPYHPFLKFRAMRLSGNYWVSKLGYKGPITTKESQNAIEVLVRALNYFSEACDDANLPFSDFFLNVELYFMTFQNSSGDLEQAFQLLEPILKEKFGENSIQYQTSLGMYKLLLSKREEEHKKNHEQFRKEAFASLRNAWSLDPARKEIAHRLMNIAYVDDNEDLFDIWYQNLIFAEPGSKVAFEHKVSFLRENKNHEKFYSYGMEVAESGTEMINWLPEYYLEKYAWDFMKADKVFWWDHIYGNSKAAHLLNTAYSNYLSKRPDDLNKKIEYAYYMGYYGFWTKAQEIFESITNIDDYSGHLHITNIKEIKEEAHLYERSGFKAPLPYYIDTEKRLFESYEKRVKRNKFNFLELYKKHNHSVNDDLAKALQASSEYWYRHPDKFRDLVNTVQIPYEIYSKEINKGNKDPLIKFLWALQKDYAEKGSKSETFKAVSHFCESDYPDYMKVIVFGKSAINFAIQKKKTKDEKEKFNQLSKKLVHWFSGSREELLYIRDYLFALRRLKRINKNSLQELESKLKLTGNKYALYMCKGFLHNQLAVKALWGNDPHEGFRQELIAKSFMKKAWLLNPHDELASEHLQINTRPSHHDYYINVRRAMFNNLDRDGIVKYTLFIKGYPHSKTKRLINYSNLRSQINLMHYHHILRKIKFYKNKMEENLASHWDDVSYAFDRYLKKYPGDSLIRSKYAKHAVQCKQLDKAKEQIQILGEYGHPQVFGGRKKMDEFFDKYGSNKKPEKAAKEPVLEK